MNRELLDRFDGMHICVSNISTSHLFSNRRKVERIKEELLQNITILKNQYQNSGTKDLNVNILLEQFNKLKEKIVINSVTKEQFVYNFGVVTSLINSLSSQCKTNFQEENKELKKEMQSMKDEIREMKEVLKLLMDNR